MSDTAGTVNVDTLERRINDGIGSDRERTCIDALDALSDLAARAQWAVEAHSSAIGRELAAERRAEAAEADRDRLARRVAELEQERDTETAAWLEAAGTAFPDFDFSGCYDQDDLRSHLVGQAGTHAERVAELEAALREVVGASDHHYFDKLQQLARAALAGDGGGA